MKVDTIVMEPAEAQQKLDAYRDALSKRHSAQMDEEWSAAERAYRELAKGTPLLDPINAIREAGWRPDGRPVFAMARADTRLCRWKPARTARWYDSEARTFKGNWSPMLWRFVGSSTRDFNGWGRGKTIEVPDVKTQPPAEPKSGMAMVPMVPPDVLPARGCDLRKHFVLWEVESWNVAPPIDPILLRPIGGDLYAVVAQWDLTELERAIIKGTRK